MRPGPRATSGALAAAALLVAALLPSRADARCSPRDARPRFMAHQFLVSVLNPLGIEHNLRVGVCMRLFESPSIVFDRNHFEVGLSTYVSPVYFLGGAYVQAAPTSFWFFRFEAHGMGMWSIPMNGAGYYTRPGYGSPYTSSDLPADQGGSAGGVDLRAISVLRGRIPLGPKFSLAAFDALFVDHPRIGTASHYVSLQHDLVLGRNDAVVGNEGTIVLTYPFSHTGELRVGTYSALRYVPESGYLGHQVGGLLGLAWDAPGRFAEGVSIFARLGGYTHHAYRTDPTALLGLAVDWDLAGVGRP